MCRAGIPNFTILFLKVSTCELTALCNVNTLCSTWPHDDLRDTLCVIRGFCRGGKALVETAVGQGEFRDEQRSVGNRGSDRQMAFNLTPFDGDTFLRRRAGDLRGGALDGLQNGDSQFSVQLL